jgi:large subunit ribosomal protein L18e
MKKKTNPVLAETILIAKKNNLVELAAAISVSARKLAAINLDKINESKAEVVIIPGKVLSGGEIKRKCKVYALGFSKLAEEKLKKAGCEAEKLSKVLKTNKKLTGEIIK